MSGSEFPIIGGNGSAAENNERVGLTGFSTPTPSADIVETTTQTFKNDVIAASQEKPVIVDFWAPWCGPCKQLTPLLEAAVKAAKGKVKLAKMNIDQHPAIAGQLGIQSIPAVIAFKDGQPIDGFMGALPQSEISAFIDRLGGNATAPGVTEALSEADAMRAAGDIARAAELYGAALSADPDNPKAIAGLAQVHITAGNLENARHLINGAPDSAMRDPAIASARAALELAERSADLDDLADLLEAVNSNPADHAARFELALGLSARGKKREAVEELLQILKQDRAWEDGKARTQLLQFFDAWGGKDPATQRGRRQLSALLFS